MTDTNTLTDEQILTEAKIIRMASILDWVFEDKTGRYSTCSIAKEIIELEQDNYFNDIEVYKSKAIERMNNKNTQELIGKAVDEWAEQTDFGKHDPDFEGEIDDDINTLISSLSPTEIEKLNSDDTVVIIREGEV